MRSRTFFLQECSPFAMVLVSGSPAAVVLASPTSFRRFGRRSFRGSLPSRCVRRINFRCGRVTANKLIDSARPEALDELPQFWNVLVGDIPLRILKTRPEFSEKSMGALALPAKSSTNKEKAFSQVVSCFANGLRMRRISLLNCNCIGGMETQFLAKPVFGVSPVHPGTLFQKSNNGLAKAAW